MLSSAKQCCQAAYCKSTFECFKYSWGQAWSHRKRSKSSSMACGLGWDGLEVLQKHRRVLEVFVEASLEPRQALLSAGLHDALLRHRQRSVVLELILRLDHEPPQPLQARLGSVVQDVIELVGGIKHLRHAEGLHHVRQIRLAVRLQLLQ